MEVASERSPLILLSEHNVRPLASAALEDAGALLEQAKEAVSGFGWKEWLGVAGAAFLLHRLVLRRERISMEGALVLVAGPVRGVGGDLCRQLTLNGANVIMISRDENGLQQLQDEIRDRGKGGRIMCALVDFLEGASMATLEMDVKDNLGVPDFVITIPDLYDHKGLEQLTYEEIGERIEGSIASSAMVCRAFFKHMIKRNAGVVAIVQSDGKTSISATQGAVQSGLRGLADALSADAWGTGVAVQEVLLPHANLGKGPQEGFTKEYASWVIDALQRRIKLVDYTGRKAGAAAVTVIQGLAARSSLIPDFSTEAMGQWIQDGEGGRKSYSPPSSSPPAVSPIKETVALSLSGPVPQAGVGIMLSLEHNGLQIISITSGSPAEESGSLQRGDVLMAIDNKAVDSFDVGEAIKMLQGPSGSHVTITVKTGGPFPKENKVRLTRGMAKDTAWISRNPDPTISERKSMGGLGLSAPPNAASPTPKAAPADVKLPEEDPAQEQSEKSSSAVPQKKAKWPPEPPAAPVKDEAPPQEAAKPDAQAVQAPAKPAAPQSTPPADVEEGKAKEGGASKKAKAKVKAKAKAEKDDQSWIKKRKPSDKGDQDKGGGEEDGGESGKKQVFTQKAVC